MSARGVRVLDTLDPEFGVMVAGTLDPAIARPLAARFELDRQGYNIDEQDDDTRVAREYVEEWMTLRGEAGWWRKVPAPPDNTDGWTWVLWPAVPGARGAFRAVEFRR